MQKALDGNLYTDGEMMNEVAVINSTYRRVRENLERGIDLVGGLCLAGKSKVVIKINFCDVRTVDTGAVTHPIFLDALLSYLRDQYSDIPIYVVESDGAVVFADEFVKWLGYKKVIDKWNAKFVNLSKDAASDFQVNGLHFSSLPIPDTLRDSYFITLAKLKTNVMSQITCALKNQYGCMPEVDKAQYHSVLEKVIADVNLAYRPDFCIVDGILGQGGTEGPAFGVPIPAKVIVLGKDPVAVDSVCAKIIGFPPSLVGHIRAARRVGIGNGRYSLVGDPIPEINFHAKLMYMLVFRMGIKLRDVILARRREKSFRG
jgi:uncharacterized protein (DUF362 family)